MNHWPWLLDAEPGSLGNGPTRLTYNGEETSIPTEATSLAPTRARWVARCGGRGLPSASGWVGVGESRTRGRVWHQLPSTSTLAQASPASLVGPTANYLAQLFVAERGYATPNETDIRALGSDRTVVLTKETAASLSVVCIVDGEGDAFRAFEIAPEELHRIGNKLRVWGRGWMLLTFSIGGLVGSWVSLKLNPTDVVSVGASGAIMALLGAAAVVMFRVPPHPGRTRQWLQLLASLALNLNPLASLPGEHIDYSAHAGGAVAGVVLGLLTVVVWPRGAARPGFALGVWTVAVAVLAVFGWSVAEAWHRYPEYACHMGPDRSVPKELAPLGLCRDVQDR